MTERMISDSRETKPSSRLRRFLDGLNNRLFPSDPVIAKGVSEDPIQEMLDLCTRIEGTNNIHHLLLYASRLREVSE